MLRSMHRELEAMPPPTIMAQGSLWPTLTAQPSVMLGPEASARIAADIMAIAQGVASTQADLEILRNGVADITECLEGKIRDMWDLVEAEVKSERRVSDHETLEAHFTRLNSAINARFIEFDDRIFRMNESRAGSISVQLQETIRAIKRYPDALHEIYLQISNAYRYGSANRYQPHRSYSH